MFDNKFTKRDALAESVKQVMLENEIRRQVEFTLNEQLGIHSKNALPHEYHAAYDSVLSENIDKVLNEKAPPGAKYERMVKHIKAEYGKDGRLTDKEKAIAYATAWKAAKNKKVDEQTKQETPSDVTSGAVGKGNPPISHDSDYYGEKAQLNRMLKIPKDLPKQRTLDLRLPTDDKLYRDMKEQTKQETIGARITHTPLPASTTKLTPKPSHPSAADAQALQNKVKEISAPDLNGKPLPINEKTIADILKKFKPKKPEKAETKPEDDHEGDFIKAQSMLDLSLPKKRVDESLESILEEITNNLQEQFVYIYENGDYDMMNEFLGSLTEEQAALLGLSEQPAVPGPPPAAPPPGQPAQRGPTTPARPGPTSRGPTPPGPQLAANRLIAPTGGSFAGQPGWARKAFNPDTGG